MRTVRGPDGTRYVLIKESGESGLVRNPETGERQHVPTADLEPVEGESPLMTEARAIPESVRTVLTAARDDRSLGLLVTLDARGPLSVRSLLAETDLCESDLHGLLAEFRAAGLLSEERVAGERGYDTTDTASEALEKIRQPRPSSGVA